MSVLAETWSVGLVTPYTLLVIGGIAVSAMWWTWLTRRKCGDVRLPVVYACGLLGALVGAKVSFLLAEGWKFRDDWVALLSGKSITGALLAGYLGVEIGKRLLRYRSATGDLFACVVPVGIAIGRLGCIVQGCCPGVACERAWWTVVGSDGVARWPAAQMELGFNVLFLAWAMLAARFGWAKGNRFHVYLMAYGAFRFAHECVRDDARVVGPIGVYHVLAAGMVVLGAWRYGVRRREMLAEPVIGAG